jgi:hypothetical protein
MAVGETMKRESIRLVVSLANWRHLFVKLPAGRRQGYARGAANRPDKDDTASNIFSQWPNSPK